MGLKAQITQAWVVVRTAPERPMEFAFILTDGQVVDARMTDGQEIVVIKRLV